MWIMYTGVLGQVNLWCSVLSVGWSIMLGLTGVPALLELLLLPFCPESPRYMLIQRGDDNNARTGIILLLIISEIK